MEHDGCVGCKYERESADSTYCTGCKQNAIDKYERRTNADRIRAMSDEELEQFAIHISEIHPLKNDGSLLIWLKSATED